MRGIRVLSVSCLTLLVLGASAVNAAASKLLLTSAGKVVAPGSGDVGTLRFGPCGSFKSTGTLANNGAMADKSAFTAFESNAGGCGEGGPSVGGQLEGIVVTSNGLMTLTGKFTYITELPKKCEYSLTKLMGKFPVPGTTSAQVSGTAKRVMTGSEHGCKGAIHLTGEEASLEDLESGTPFEASV